MAHTLAHTHTLVSASHNFRVTKYDPAFRNNVGNYLRDDWTAISDVGDTFDGVVLTRETYDRVEDAYIDAALALLDEAGVRALVVRDLEHGQDIVPGLREGSRLPLAQLGPALRAVLREDSWCRFESDDAYVHVGWDYYMFVGVPRACPKAEALAVSRGLFVEPIERSPYARTG